MFGGFKKFNINNLIFNDGLIEIKFNVFVELRGIKRIDLLELFKKLGGFENISILVLKLF